MREAQNDIAGFIYAVVGVIYAVLLAFTVIMVWEEFSDTKLLVDREAASLGDLYQLAEQMPAQQRQPIRTLVQQ